MISVCMATYNGERFIKQQIDSILCQLNSEDELIISDDGSTDGTLEIIQSYNDKRIKVLNHHHDSYLESIKRSRNYYFATSNFENALKSAKGDYIFLSDQDDLWKANKVKLYLQYLNCHKFVVSNYSVIDSDNKIILQQRYYKNPISKTIFKNMIFNNLMGCTMAFRREVLNMALPFPRRLIAHDFWLGCLFCKDIFYIPECLLLYRRYGRNVSSTLGVSNNPIWYRLQYRFILYLQILKRKKEFRKFQRK